MIALYLFNAWYEEIKRLRRRAENYPGRSLTTAVHYCFDVGHYADAEYLECGAGNIANLLHSQLLSEQLVTCSAINRERSFNILFC